jgi:hypothetical protein
MPRARVKLVIKAEDGRRRETQWFFSLNNEQTFVDVAEEGCKRLGIYNAFSFNVYEVQSCNEESPTKLRMDEIVDADKSYLIVDESLECKFLFFTTFI